MEVLAVLTVIGVFILGLFVLFISIDKGSSLGKLLGAFLCLLVVLLVGVGFYALPKYRVWQQGLEGEAEFARAEQNKRIRIESAKAKEQAADHEAKAEVIKARGVAEANKIIADGLGGPEGYLRWRYIEMLQETGNEGRETIYIPTEAGIPILEARNK